MRLSTWSGNHGSVWNTSNPRIIWIIDTYSLSSAINHNSHYFRNLTKKNFTKHFSFRWYIWTDCLSMLVNHRPHSILLEGKMEWDINDGLRYKSRRMAGYGFEFVIEVVENCAQRNKGRLTQRAQACLIHDFGSFLHQFHIIFLAFIFQIPFQNKD